MLYQLDTSVTINASFAGLYLGNDSRGWGLRVPLVLPERLGEWVEGDSVTVHTLLKLCLKVRGGVVT